MTGAALDLVFREASGRIVAALASLALTYSTAAWPLTPRATFSIAERACASASAFATSAM